MGTRLDICAARQDFQHAESMNAETFAAGFADAILRSSLTELSCTFCGSALPDTLLAAQLGRVLELQLSLRSLSVGGPPTLAAGAAIALVEGLSKNTRIVSFSLDAAIDALTAQAVASMLATNSSLKVLEVGNGRHPDSCPDVESIKII